MQIRTTLSVLTAVAFCTSGCSNLTPKQQAIATTVGHSLVSLSQTVADIVLQVIIAKATSGADLTDKANLLDSAASGLRSIETTSGGIVTSSEVGEAVRSFTDPNKVHWTDFADSLADAFSNSAPPANEKLEAMATTLNVQAATVRDTQ